jgi:hypothetical protein
MESGRMGYIIDLNVLCSGQMGHIIGLNEKSRERGLKNERKEEVE